MFGLKKKKAINIASEAVAQLIRTTSHLEGLPVGFWNDPYVLGFLTATAAMFAEASYGEKPPTEELGFIILGVYEKLNPAEFLAISRRVTDLQNTRNPEYFLATEKAFKTVALIYGMQGLSSDPDVIAATRMAKELTQSGLTSTHTDSNAAVGGMLQSMLFHDVVKKRLGRT